MTTALAISGDDPPDLEGFKVLCFASLSYLRSMAAPLVGDDVFGTLANQLLDWRAELGVTEADVAVAVRRLIHPDTLGACRYRPDAWVVTTFARLVGEARRERLERDERRRQADYLRAAPATPEELENRAKVLGIMRRFYCTPGGVFDGEEEGPGPAAGGEDGGAAVGAGRAEGEEEGPGQADPGP